MISPVQIYAAALAGANGNVSVDLLGEDGRQIYTEKIHFNTASGARVGIERQIPFSLSGVAEEGCLRVYSLDEYNRLVSLGSSKIILLSVGENDPITDIYQQEPFYFLSPRPMDAIRGGIVEIKGIASYVTQNPLLVELVDSSGQVIASDLTNQLPSDDPKRVPFQSVLKYQITTPTWVRLIIHERDLRLNMDLAASSMLIKIIP